MSILFLSLLTLAASWTGTITGFGSSTIMVPVLLFFYPLPETLLFVGIVHLFNDLWKVLLFRQGIKWKLILGFGIPGIVGAYLGARLVFVASFLPLEEILGGLLVGYVVFMQIEHKFVLPQKWYTDLSGGTLSGIFAGVLGIGGAIRSAFLNAYSLPSGVYIATSGAVAMFIDLSRLVTYFASGVKLEGLFWNWLPLFIVISFFGALIARIVVKHLPKKEFRFIIAGFLLLIGLKLLFF